MQPAAALPGTEKPNNGQPDTPAPPPVRVIEFLQFADGHIEINSAWKDGSRVVDCLIKHLPIVWNAALQQSADEHRIVKPGAGIMSRIRGGK